MLEPVLHPKSKSQAAAQESRDSKSQAADVSIERTPRLGYASIGGHARTTCPNGDRFSKNAAEFEAMGHEAAMH